MTKLKEKIIQKIEQGEVKQTSRGYFLIKKYTFWGLFGFSIIFGAVSFSILLNNIFDDFGPWYKLKIETSFWLSNIFWIWIVFLIIFIIVAVFNFRQTKKAYKIKIIWILLLSIGTSLLIGYILYFTHLGKLFDNQFVNYNHSYKTMKEKRKKIILDYLEQEGIDRRDFFENKKIIKLKEEWKEVDKKRINKLKMILEEYKNKKNNKKLRLLFNQIKEKKKEVDYQRFLKEIEIYKESVL